MRRIAILIAGLAALLVAAGFAGTLARPVDTLALARPVFAPLVLLGALAARRTAWRLGFAALGCGALASVVLPFLPQPSGGDLRVYSKNLLNDRIDVPPLFDDIQSQRVDVVFLQEVSPGNTMLLDRLKADFPHQHLCAFSRWSGIAIASKLPFDGPPGCSDRRALAAAPVRIEGEKVWLVSAHIPWQWPYDTARAEASGRAYLESLDAPAVIAGDFNSFPWTSRVRWFASAGNTRPAGPTRPTFYIHRLPLPIDHAFAPGGGTLEKRPRFGSDHFGIVADLSLKR